MSSVGILATAILLIGMLFNNIVSSNVYGVIESFQNKVDILTDSKHKNDCDEFSTGTNNDNCSNVDRTVTDQIILIDKNNKFILKSNVNQIQKCDILAAVLTMLNAPTTAIIYLIPMRFLEIIIKLTMQ